MIEIIESEIDSAALLAAVNDPDAGANLLFVGTTRRVTGQRETSQLNYDCYREMAAKKLAEIRAQAMERWPLKAVHIVHRVGDVPVGAASLAVAVSSPHRAEAFQAAQWIIDTLKEIVPIWKQEVYSDGKKVWVHPGASPSSSQ